MNGLSFVIPCFNSEETISICINSILSQEELIPFEIIVVDNNSTKPVEKIIKHKKCKIIKETKQGRSFARNSGAQIASYEYICFLDSDVKLESNWLKNTVDFISKTQFDGYEAFVKNTEITKKNTFLSDYRDLFRGGAFNLEDTSVRKFPIINTACCVYKTESFKKLEGFDTELNWCEDADFSKRLFLSGGNISVLPDSKCSCFYSAGLYGYIKRKFTAGDLSTKYLYKWEKRLDPVNRVFFNLLGKFFSPREKVLTSGKNISRSLALFHRLLLLINFFGHMLGRFKYKKDELSAPYIVPFRHSNTTISANYNVSMGRSKLIIRDIRTNKMFSQSFNTSLILNPKILLGKVAREKLFYLRYEL